MNQKPPKQISEVKRQNWPVATDLNFQPILQRNSLRAKPRKWLYLSPEVPNLKNKGLLHREQFWPLPPPYLTKLNISSQGQNLNLP